MEYIKIYLKEADKITEKVIDVNDVSHYVGMGWTLEKPEKKDEEKAEKVEKVISKKEHKKENKKNV